MKIGSYETHPLADAFPLMEGDEFDQLVQSIREHGQIMPAIVADRLLADGRNKIRACEKLGIEPKIEEFDGSMPLQEFIWTVNVDRRHLTEDQKAAAAEAWLDYERAQAKERQKLSQGRGIKGVQDPAHLNEGQKVRDALAKRADVSRYRAGQVIKVADHDREHGTHYIDLVRAGELKLRDAERAVQYESAPTVDECKTDQTDDLRKLIASGESFTTFLADPPWDYNNRGFRGAAANHYPCMSVEEICALPIAELAAPNAHLHLWTTTSFLREAFDVMDSWGFIYKSCFVWNKPRMGMGHYWRISHEILFLGVRGSLPFQVKNEKSWAEYPTTEHSAKPEQIRRKIETVSPGPYLELFAREAAPGWTAWGNEVDSRLQHLPTPAARWDLPRLEGRP